jgi:nucleoside-diphosphate-sugar epimerase
MRTLVTGGHGFVGSHLVRRLVAEGTHVRCLVRRDGVPPTLAGLGVELVVGDLDRPETLRAAVDGVDEVVHLAARLTARSEREMFRTNAGGTRALLDATVAAGGVGRFVHCSSIAVAGPCEPGTAHAEAPELRPVSWYGASKALAERVVLAFGARGLPFTIVRPPAVYGPRDRGMLSVFRLAARGLAPLVGTQPRSLSWVYGPDLADALVVLGRSPATLGRTYFAAHPEVTTMEGFLDVVSAAVGRGSRRLVVPDSLLRLAASGADLVAQVTGTAAMLTRNKANELLAPHWVCSTEAAARDAGWRAATPLSVGVPETVRWYREHRWL